MTSSEYTVVACYYEQDHLDDQWYGWWMKQTVLPAEIIIVDDGSKTPPSIKDAPKVQPPTTPPLYNPDTYSEDGHEFKRE